MDFHLSSGSSFVLRIGWNDRADLTLESTTHDPLTPLLATVSYLLQILLSRTRWSLTGWGLHLEHALAPEI